MTDNVERLPGSLGQAGLPARGCGRLLRVGRAGGVLVAACVVGAGCRAHASVPPGFQGILEYDERIIGFELPGRVSDVPVHRGQVVDAGDILARLDDSLELASRDARQAELEAAQADLALFRAGSRREDISGAAADLSGAIANEALARKDAERKRVLVHDGAIPQAEEDRAEGDLEQASARRASLESRLALLRRGARREEIARAEANVQSRASALAEGTERLARYVLRAQEKGRILDVTVKPGEIAAPGTPAVTMADVAHPYADVFVPEGRLGAIQVGAQGEARVDALTDPFRAVVEYVSPDTEFTPKFLFSDRERPNLVIRVRVRIDDPGNRLHSGVPVFVKVAQ
jgi:HlyD family secretion protein